MYAKNVTKKNIFLTFIILRNVLVTLQPKYNEKDVYENNKLSNFSMDSFCWWKEGWLVFSGLLKENTVLQKPHFGKCLKSIHWIFIFFKLFIYFALFKESARFHADTPSMIHLNCCLSFVYWAFQPSKSCNCSFNLGFSIASFCLQYMPATHALKENKTNM